MATFQVSNKNKNKSNKNVKVITGWILLAVSTFIFLFSITDILVFLKTFFLGVFGIFVYPLSLVGMIVSLALLNNKKYVMPKSYAIFLMLSLYFLLAIIQLVIIGGCGDLSYADYVGQNYSLQITAGGLFIGFLPSTLMYFMGSAATYIVLSLALITSVTFFIQAFISVRKTKEAEKPIKLQIKEKDNFESIEDRRDAMVFQKVQAQENENNVMLDGYMEQEETKQRNARELLGLVGGNKQQVVEEYYSPHDMIFPSQQKKEEKLPEGMSVREYLLSPPKVDLKKFKEQQARLKPHSNYILNVSKKAQALAADGIVANASEIVSNINELKEMDMIQQMDAYQEEYTGPVQSKLPDVKPEEITNEAEDIIRAVVEQEKLERAEQEQIYFGPNDQISELEDDYSSITSDSIEDLNEFIDFDDIDGNGQKTQNLPNSRDNFARDLSDRRNNFNRDNNFARDNMRAREELPRRDNFGQRDNMPNRELPNRDTFARREAIPEGRDRQFAKPVYNDEMARRRGMVEVEGEKKDQIFKPYKYNRPSLDLITTTSDDPATFNGEMTQKTVALENALENFGIPAKVQNVVIGPTVTRYEIEMPDGISVKRILSLDADIAYALCAEGQIRIEAPVPGRSVVGIEVPNKRIAKVSIKDVLSSKEFNLSPSPLTFALGKDITGNVKICNLQKMPHLLVAGTTGSGKSICLNSIIVSLLYKSSPDDVKFIMIDPKQVELSMYEGLPHMVIPKVITDPTKAVNALGWAVDEMERRFRLISEARVRDIQEYNKTEKVQQCKAKKMPFIVIIFDEFADFMQVAKNEIEDRIKRLAGKARAAGIHLILATQRPSTDVVTGTLKANLPARIAFKVAGRVDSEVIMGATGAEKLLGRGDMLYKPTDSDASRIQGCFIDTGETLDIVSYIQQNNEETFDPEALEAINNPNKAKNNGDNNANKIDDLLPQALKICIDNGVASTTMIQRKLSIGYPRAAKIIDQMEERGYISSADGAKQRTVYLTIEEFYGIFGDIYD